MDTAKSSILSGPVAPLTVSLPHRLRERLMQRAVLLQTSASMIVQEALAAYLQDQVEVLTERRPASLSIQQVIEDGINAATLIRKVLMQPGIVPLTSEKVYIIRAVHTDFVKIGRSIDPAGRVRELQGANMYTLRLTHVLPVVDADKLEKRLHTTLRRFRMQGEWFQLTPQLLDFILGKGNFLV